MPPGVGPVSGWESSSERYEQFMGRWSRPLAARLAARLGAEPGAVWADVGCGTGALAEAVLAVHRPGRVVALDPSAAFVAAARARLQDRAAVLRADAQALPLADASCDAVAAVLVLNFVPDRARAVAEAARVARPGGRVAACVWDYAEGMQLLRAFWDAAVALDPSAEALDEAVLAAGCGPAGLRSLWEEAGLADVEVAPLVVPTVLADDDDCWTPFLSGGAPAPTYAQSLPGPQRAALREGLLARLPRAADGSLPLSARAWAVVGTREG